ncbi:MAG: glycoside hydrolase family 9 protein [Pseudomonadota bacterium]
MTAVALLLCAGALVNQLGYAPAATKVAVSASTTDTFDVLDQAGTSVLHGTASRARSWEPSGEAVRLLDFSALKAEGSYRIKSGDELSPPFSIARMPYREVNAAALKAYYFNRASTALPAQFAGPYARAAGHPDMQVIVHASAASPARPEGTIIASPKGWYDAGDYNKYVVNSGIATYTLLSAYEHFPAYFKQQHTNIPETGNGMPDILNEALWNIEWLLTMQDPNDGGVYHKLTNLRFDGMVMPGEATTARYVVQKTTAATLDFAAVMATASRVYAPVNKPLAARMLASAQEEWNWAKAHPKVAYRQPPDVVTGEYGDNDFTDEFTWAGAELFIATGEHKYFHAMTARAATVPTWDDVASLAWMSLAFHRPPLGAARIEALARSLVQAWKASAYGVPMQHADFVWGSNAVALNQAMMLLHAYRINKQRDYLDAAQAAFDYVMGRNATGYSFVTGFGSKTPQHPHHRQSQADAVAAPVPGFVVGGPQPGQQDKGNCKMPYPSILAATSYLDEVCSYASNEVAINWNAPLVYVSAALDVY